MSKIRKGDYLVCRNNHGNPHINPYWVREGIVLDTCNNGEWIKLAQEIEPGWLLANNLTIIAHRKNISKNQVIFILSVIIFYLVVRLYI
jgi:hypothetical protein